MILTIKIDTSEEGFTEAGASYDLRKLADAFATADTRTTPLPEATVTESTSIVADDRVKQMFTEASDVVENGDFAQGDKGWIDPTKDEASVVPAVPVVPTVDTSAGTAELDANGLPWDERINAATRTMTAKGIWKRKPRIDDELYNSVIAELKGSSSSSQATTAGVPVITEETPLPPGDDEAINGQELFMEVIRLNMAIKAGELTNTLAMRLGLENVNFLAQADQETLATYKNVFDQIKGINDLAQATAVVDMLCPAQS